MYGIITKRGRQRDVWIKQRGGHLDSVSYSRQNMLQSGNFIAYLLYFGSHIV